MSCERNDDMTKYLTEYMADIAARLGSCPDMDTLDELIAEHRTKLRSCSTKG